MSTDPTPTADFEAADKTAEWHLLAGTDSADANLARAYQQLRQRPTDKPAADGTDEISEEGVNNLIVRNRLAGRHQNAWALGWLWNALAAERAARERLETAARTVHDTFVSDESAGYKSRDRQYAIAILGAALSPTGQAASTKEGE